MDMEPRKRLLEVDEPTSPRMTVPFGNCQEVATEVISILRTSRQKVKNADATCCQIIVFKSYKILRLL